MKLGILQLDTPFERLPGDAGHAATWPFAVQVHIMHGVTPDKLLQGSQQAGVLDVIAAAAQTLAADGADVITTTCGFLVLQQAEIAARCPVPFISSSLLQIPWLLGLLPVGKTIGVIASQKEALTSAHWRAAGVPVEAEGRLQVVGFTDESHFIRTLRGQDKPADPKRTEQEVVAVAHALVQQHPDVGVIVSECANLPRYSALIRQHTHRAVFDLRTMVLWYVSGMSLQCMHADLGRSQYC